MSELNILTYKPTNIINIQSIAKSSEESIENLVDQSNTNLLNCVPMLVLNLYDTSKTNIWDLINQKNGVVMAQVFEHLENVDCASSNSLIIHAHPSVISSIAEQIVENTVNMTFRYIPLNYKSTLSLGICFIGYRDEYTTYAALADKKKLIKRLEKEYGASIKEYIGERDEIYEIYEKLLLPLVVNDDTFEHAETRMIIVKGIPTINNKSRKASERLLLRLTLNSMFSRYGNIIRSYLPLNINMTSTLDFYVIEYDNNVNIQLIIDSENGKPFDKTPLVVSRFNDNI